MNLQPNEGNKPVRIVVPEMDWLGERREELEREHPGKWVAIKGRELIAIGDTLRDVMEESKAKGVEQPLVAGLKRKEYQGVYLIRSPRLVRPIHADR